MRISRELSLSFLAALIFLFQNIVNAHAEQIRCNSLKDYDLEDGSLKNAKNYNEIFFIDTITGKVIGDGPMQSTYSVVEVGGSATTLKLQNEYKSLVVIYWERPKSFIFTDMRTGHVVTGNCN